MERLKMENEMLQVSGKKVHLNQNYIVDEALTTLSAAAHGSKTYILRSVLHPNIIEHAALTDERILEEEAADAPSEDDDDETYPPPHYGCLLSWSSADQLDTLGILYTILALILVSGRVVSDGTSPSE